MTDELREYLTFPPGYYCAWEVDGSALAWSDGRTIAFREELQGIVRGLNAKRLPPLGALAMLLAACRDNWAEAPARRELVWGTGHAMDPASAAAHHFETVFHALDELHAVWRDNRSDPLAKVRLAAAVFCDGRVETLCPAIDPAVVVRGLSCELPRPPKTGPKIQQRLLAELRLLAKALERIDARTLGTRITVGLDQLVVPPPQPLALPPGGTVRDLLRELEEDEELSGIARLARMLLASVDLPRAVSDPDEFAEGGVSDIANRGELDRLLLSELAHDDMTLAVRVAMREALYLRREVPPRAPPHRRIVLVDSGLRMWGLPRVFGTSVALALAAPGDERIDVQVYRSTGNVATESDFTTRTGLVEHLAELDHRAHPGPALAALVGDLRKDEDAPPADLTIVTCEETLADRAFQQALESLELSSLYLATVNREGELKLLERSPTGRKVLRQAKLNLEEILEGKAAAKNLRRADRGDLPAIATVEPFPLLLPVSVTAHRAWEAGPGVLQFTKDGRLMNWNDRLHGAQQIACGLGEGRVHWASSELVDGKSIAVVGKMSQRGLKSVVFEPATGRHTIQTLVHSIEPPFQITGHGNTVFVFNQEKIDALDASSGDVLDQLPIDSHLVWQGQRFFQMRGAGNNRAWKVLSFDGSQIQLTGWLANVPEGCVKLIETRGREGFTAVTRTTELVHCDTAWKRKLYAGGGTIESFHVLAVARDGLRFAAELATTVGAVNNVRDRLLVFPLNGHSQPLIGDPEEAVEPVLKKYAKGRNIRQKFESIVCDARGRLLLSSRKGQFWALEFHAGQQTLVFASRPLERSQIDLRGTKPVLFEHMDADSSEIPLRMAKWSDGSRAWLDPRGLLHLRSADREIPECSIVLAVGQTAGWVADGRQWGDEYYLGKLAKPADVSAIYVECIRPFSERLP